MHEDWKGSSKIPQTKLVKGGKLSKWKFLPEFSLKNVVKIIISNIIPDLIYISVRTVKKPCMTVRYKWIFIFCTSYCTALTYPDIAMFSVLFHPVLNDMTKIGQSILVYYSYYAILLIFWFPQLFSKGLMFTKTMKLLVHSVLSWN